VAWDGTVAYSGAWIIAHRLVQVVDPESVPSMVLKERPTTKKTHFYCVRFFPTGDLYVLRPSHLAVSPHALFLYSAWLVSKDISKLQQHEIQSYINEPYKKSGELLQGYRIALDPTKWEQEREAESRLAAEEEANAEVDQLDSENDGSGDLDEEIDLKSKKSKKRKRDSDISGSTATVKAKRALKKKDGVEGKKKSASAASGKPRKNGRKSNTMVESEEEDGDNEAGDDGDVGPSKKGSPPPPKKQKRDGEDEGDDGQSHEFTSAILCAGLNEAFTSPNVPSPQSMLFFSPSLFLWLLLILFVLFFQ
jgi:hypothetical protein